MENYITTELVLNGPCSSSDCAMKAIVLSYRFPVRFGSSIIQVLDNPRIARTSRLQTAPIDIPKVDKVVVKKPQDKRYTDFIECLKTKDSDRALVLLKEVTVVKDRMFVALMNNMATVLYKKEHLSAVQDIIQRLEAIGIKPEEPLYSSLVKCYMDDKNIDESLKVFKYMVDNSFEVKTRTLLPILEGLRDSKDITRMLPVLEYMTKTMDAKPEHLTVVLEAIGDTSSSVLDSEHKIALDAFLTHCSEQMLGIPFVDMQAITARCNNITLEQQKEEGVLVQFVPDTVVDESTLNTKGYVTSPVQQCQAPAVRLLEALPSMVNTDPNHPIGLSEFSSPTVEVMEKLFVRSAVDTLRKSTTARRSKIVNIDAKTCQCPNCNATLSSLALNEAEKKIVRTRLRSLSKETNDQLSHLKEFLNGYLGFDYIIDAANVAYYHQNDASGKFSFKQLRLMVQTLKAKSDRILMVIPSSYCQPSIPNSITGKMQPLTGYEKNVLDYLFKEITVYQVPPRTNDDWFWLYCSVMPRKRSTKPCYIVSNDLTRDHKIAFPDSSTFARWRLTQCTYFDLYRDDNSYSADMDMFLYEPGSFSRLIQKNMQPSNGEMRWHIPSVDRSSWLCVATGTSPPGEPDMPHNIAKRNITTNSTAGSV